MKLVKPDPFPPGWSVLKCVTKSHWRYDDHVICTEKSVLKCKIEAFSFSFEPHYKSYRKDQMQLKNYIYLSFVKIT